MITETKKRGQRIMLMGIVLALMSAMMTFSAIQSAQPKVKEVLYKPILRVATRIAANTSMKSAINDVQTSDAPPDSGKSVPATSICPVTELPSLTVGSFIVCLMPDSVSTLPDELQLKLITTEQMQKQNPGERQVNINLVTYELSQAIGDKYAITDLPAGMSLQLSQLATYPTIGNGMRAVSIPVGPAANVGNRVGQGDHVDVVVTYQEDANGQKVPKTEVLFQDVEVLGTSDSQRLNGRISAQQRFGDSEINPVSIVTFKMTLKDATQLIHMSNVAQDLRLVLRETDDHDIVK